jgi:hypothetical protein
MPNYDDLFTSSPSQYGNTPFDKEAWAAKKQAERESVYAMIDGYTADMCGDGGVFQAYLDVQARFDRYSVSNAILIAAQYPEATKLADFDTWKASGVYVRRGEDALTILEPGKEYEKDDGSVGVSYNVKKVFDISQTNSQQRPAPAVSRDARLLLKGLMNNAPCGFSVSNDLPQAVNAQYQPEEEVILVRQGLDAPAIFRCVAQELARAHIVKGGYVCQSPDFVSYSTAYLLCRRNNVPADRFSFAHMPEAYRTLDPREIRSEANIMREIAGTISVDMNRFFEAQNRAQRDPGERGR